MAPVMRELQVRRLGPGVRVALATLGEPGLVIAGRWRRLDGEGLFELELEACEAGLAGDGQFDESRRGARWEAYGRWGEAIVLLRRAARAMQRRG